MKSSAREPSENPGACRAGDRHLLVEKPPRRSDSRPAAHLRRLEHRRHSYLVQSTDGTLRLGKGFSCGVKHLPKLADACATAMRKAEELDLI